MKKSSTIKRTAIALDPELTKRIKKVSKNSGMKMSTYAQERLKSALDADELKQTVEYWNKLQDSSQYQKIKQLEGEVAKLKGYHITEKKISEQFKKLKSKKIDDLAKQVKEQQLRLNKIDREAALDDEIHKTTKEINKFYDKLIKNNDDDESFEKMNELTKNRDRLYEAREKLVYGE